MNYLRKYATHATPRPRPELSNYRIGPKRKANERTLAALLDEIRPVRVRKLNRIDATECVLLGSSIIALSLMLLVYFCFDKYFNPGHMNHFRSLPAPVPVRANTFRKESMPFVERIGAVLAGPDIEFPYHDPQKVRRVFGIGAIAWTVGLLGLIGYGIYHVYHLPL